MTCKVVLLTGSPATGKSSLASALGDSISDLQVINYGELILKKKRKLNPNLEYEDLREKSSMIISQKDIRDLDDELVDKVDDLRRKRSIIIDTHCVTKEFYGFRALPFAYDHIMSLSLDAIISLHCNPSIVRSRIQQNAEGRPLVTEEEARKHSELQDSYAAFYGLVSSCPIYHLDSSLPLEDLREILTDLLDLGVSE